MPGGRSENLLKMSKIGLIVEGGGMKCAFSAGILDRFLDDGITFDYCVGVSAGSANLASFMGGNRGRNRRFYTDHIKDPNYFGFRNFLKCGDLFNLRYIYATLSNEGGKDPVNYDRIMSNPCRYEMVATNAITGEPVYFDKSEMERNNYLQIMASSAIPAICKPVMINGVPYYDGGISDAIPVKRAMDMGCDKVVCLRSKSRNYVKNPEKMKLLYSIMCRKYPNAVEDMNRRHLMYRKCQKRMFKLEEEGKAFLFSLETDEKMSTYTMDADLNQRIYDLGVSEYERKREDLLKFMNE